MIQTRRHSAKRLACSGALLLIAGVLVGCETGPPELADEPPIADAPEAAPAIHTAVLQPARKKGPRLLNVAIEMRTLGAPVTTPAPDIVPRPREPDATQNTKPAEAAPPVPVATRKKTAMLAPDRPFEWPVEGKVVSTFGAGGDGARNDGINIAAEPGTPIHAAAAGTVTYAARLKGYGNLVLIRHGNGYITAYAHAQSLLVAPGDRVDRGDVIGLSGRSGDVANPQLHFEIREGTKPVDPRPLLLPSRES